mmetsp:Transcript_5716/g.16595  ORF Transcript_5716/g.16595 Transcript_5716/m.16595 type:complete len:1355 (-) Transcript_5716:243-4307(-)
MKHYSRIAEADSDGSSSLSALTVQLFTIPEVGLELITEHGLLDVLSGNFAELLEPFCKDGVMTFDEQRTLTKFPRMHRLLYDFGYVLSHPEVCQHILQTPSAQEAVMRPLQMMWRMNPQSRRTQTHILYEESAYTQVFPLESLYLQRIGPLGDYCRRPEATLEELRPWYSALSAALASPGSLVVNSMDSSSFHVPLLRVLIRCMNFEILADAGSGDWSDIFPSPVLVTILTHAVRTLRFAAEIRNGCWVRNGEAMRAQEAEYQRSLQHFDVMAVQVCLLLLARQAGPPGSAELEAGTRVEPVAQLWAAVFDDDDVPAACLEPLLLDRWHALLEACTGPAAEAAVVARARLRVDLFWGLLANALNSLFPVDFAMCSKRWASRFAARCPVLLQRSFVQALAVKPLTLPELSAAVPKELGAREAQVVEALADIAVRQDRKYALQPRSWRLYDAFLPLPPSSHATRNRSTAEEAALSQREASLLGPRCTERLSLAPQLQEELVSSLRFSQLVELVLDFVHHQCVARLFPEQAAQLSALQLDSAFAQCLKVLDVFCDIPGPDGGCSVLAAQLCQPPDPELRPGQSAAIQGLSEELDGQCGTVGPEIDSDGRHDVLLQTPAGTSHMVKALPEQLRWPTPLATRHDLLLDRFDALHKAGCDHALLARLMSPQALPQRLQDRWKALGLRGDEPLVADAHDSGLARKRLRAEAMRKRQEAVMRRMREQQRAAAAELAGDGDDGETGGEAEGTECAKNEEDEEDVGTCSTCREVGTWTTDPLTVVVAVGPSNVLKFHGGSAASTARFTSCGHLIHARCCSKQAATVRAQARRGTHFFVSTKRRQFPCPMCRSLANCALPAVPATDMLEQVVAGSESGEMESDAAGEGKLSSTPDVGWRPAGEATHWEPIRVRMPSLEIRRALLLVDRCTTHAMQEADLMQTMPAPDQEEEDETVDVAPSSQIAALVKDAACAELAVTSSLSPLQLAERGPPIPLYVMLLRSALLFRRWEGAPPAAQPPAEQAEEKATASTLPATGGASRPDQAHAEFVASSLTPSAVWTLDTKAALVDALMDGLCSQAGLSQGAFSMLVGAFLKVRAAQLYHDFGAADELSKVAAGLVSFLVFASWLCAAVWNIPAAKRTRLAYCDCSDPDALISLSALLRLTGLSSVDQVLEAARKQAFFPSALSSADAPSPSPALALATDWGLPGQSALVPFIELPENYIELVHSTYRRVCASCGRIPPEPAICLLCGALVCMDNKSCRGRNAEEGQCTDHARHCGAGQGLFLLPYLALVLAISAPIGCLWDCPYVDQNGEPNPYLRRPCAMQFRLDRRRLDALRQIYSKASIHREIILHNEKTQRYIAHAL